MTRARTSFRPRPRALALEPRLLFDGAAAVAASDTPEWQDQANRPGQEGTHGQPSSGDGASPLTHARLSSRMSTFALVGAGDVPFDDDAEVVRTTPEDTELHIEGLSIGNVSNPGTVTLRIQTDGGETRIGDLSGTSISAGANGSSDLTLSGSLAQINAALNTLYYSPTENQNSSTDGFVPSITLTATDTTAQTSGVYTVELAVTAVNDVPTLDTGVALIVYEGQSASFSLAQLADSPESLDPDIATGQQVIAQQMITVNSLPAQGELTYKGGPVLPGAVIPVTDLASLRYTHDGTDIESSTLVTFEITVSDGGGGHTDGIITLDIRPTNVAPTIGGDFTLYEGQVKNVAPTIDLGDTFDTMATATVTIDSVVTGGQGVFFIDANGDGVPDPAEVISGARSLTGTQLAQLKFAHNGYEPNTPGAVAPSYTITVTDNGGGTGTKASTTETFTLLVMPNNDDPTLSNAHSTEGTALGTNEGTVTAITSGMLQISDVDLNPFNLGQTTPTDQLVYTVETRPTQGEIQVFVGGGLGPDNNGWIILGDGGRFTQKQVNDGQVRYYQTTEIVNDTIDGFTFTVRDSAFGYDVWTNPENPTGPREGGVRDTPTGDIALQHFYLNVRASNDPHTNTYIGDPRPATAGYGGPNMRYDFEPDNMSNGNGSATWLEANVGAGGGYVITQGMLAYTITRTDTVANASVTLPPAETVYTLTVQPPNGKVERYVNNQWEVVTTNSQFTQADINANRIRFVHDGSENHTASFGYRVSDGTRNDHSGDFTLNITPTNDRPTANGGVGRVVEGDGNTVRLDGSVVGMADIDLSQDPTKRTGEGAQDFLWFRIDSLPEHGKLERWNGTAWVAVNLTDWLPSTVLTANADGAASGLRYVHDGTEPLAYAGGPKVTFNYVVRDDLTAPGNAFSTVASTPGDTSNTVQSNISLVATATVNITPVNNAPQIADKPGDTDPNLGNGNTIPGGGATQGANTVLEDVLEGGSAVITSAHLTAVDQDNTTVQRQYRIMQATTLGDLQLGGKTLGVGSTFTQDDIDSGRLVYKHGGDDVLPRTTDHLGTYNDKFHFVVSDGVLEDVGKGSDYNVFLITLAPANDPPTVTGPTTPIDVVAQGNNSVAVPGITVTDRDLVTLEPGEVNFLRVELSVRDASDALVPGATLTLTPTGSPSDPSSHRVTGVGTNSIVIQGTQQEVQAMIDTLRIAYGNDRDSATDKLVVTVDDRLYNSAGALIGSANGGIINQGETPADQALNDANNRSTIEIALIASNENDLPGITNSNIGYTVNEDATLTLSGFTLTDADSFDKPVSVTVTLYADAGYTTLANASTEGKLTTGSTTGVTATGSGGNTVTLTGTMADVQNALNALRFQGAQDFNEGPLYVRVDFTDFGHADVPDGHTVSIDRTIEIVPVNDPPVLTVPSAPFLLDTGNSVAIPGISFQDERDVAQGASDDFYTVTITAPTAGDTLAVSQQGSATASYDPDTRVLTIEGSRTDVNATLATLTYAPADTNVDKTYQLDIVVDDHDNGREGTGVSGPTTAIGEVFVFVSGVNDPAHITAHDVTVSEGSTTVTLNGTHGNIVVDDPDHNGGIMTATVSVPPEFTISAVTGTGGTVTGVGSSEVVITGTQDQINAYLKNLTITFPEGTDGAQRDDWNGSFDVTVVVNDGGNTGTRPGTLIGDTDQPRTGYGDFDYFDDTSNTLVTTRIITVTVTPENDAPIRIGTGQATLPGVPEDSSNPSGHTVDTLFGPVFSDARDEIAGGSNASPITGVAITGNSAIAGQGTWQYSVDGNSWVDLPTVSNTSALLLSADTQLRFVPTADFHGTPGGLTARLVDDSGGPITAPATVNVSGNLSGGTTRYSDAANAVTLNTTVTPINDAPSFTGNTTLPSIAEDGTGSAQSAATIAGALTYSDATDDREGTTGGGTTAGGNTAIAIVGNHATSAEGTWQYTLDGSTWVDVPTGINDSNAVVLDVNDPLHQVRFVPGANFVGTPGALDLRAADDTWDSNTGIQNLAGSTGGTHAWSANTASVDVAVLPANDAPTLTHQATSPTVTENDQTGTGVSIPPVALLTGGTVSDVDLGTTPGLDSTIFGAGTITLTLDQPITGDVLGLLPGTTLPTGVQVNDSTLGTLTITLTTDTTVAEVEALLAALSYSHTTDNPTDFGNRDTITYTVVLSDGNNAQPGGNNAGGPQGLSAIPIEGTITLVATNDPPVATDDVNRITEDTVSVVGNVNPGTPGQDSDIDNTHDELTVTSVRTGPEADGGAMTPVPPTGLEITGLYGKLVIQPDGSYEYFLDNANPIVNALQDGEELDDVFTYTISDPDGLSDTAQLTITIDGVTDGAPGIAPVDINGQATVYEAGLTNSDGSHVTTGTLAITSPDGLATVTIGGTMFTVAELQALSTGNPSAVIDTGEGLLRITGITVNAGPVEAPTDATVSYQYTLKDAIDQPSAIDSEDTITLSITDRASTTADGTLVVRIVDDTPTARDDVNSVVEGRPGTVTTTTGNVVTKDSAGDVADRVGADARPDPVTEVSFEGMPGTIGAPIEGRYGSLTLNADGSYVYTLNNDHPEVIALTGHQSLTEVFDYTLSDADGDTDTATLTITINGRNDPPVAIDDGVLTTLEDTPLRNIPVLNNDSDPDGDPVSIVSATVPPNQGTVTINPDGTLDFVPAPNFHGTVEITYTITDGISGTSTAKVTIVVESVNDVPVAVDDVTTTKQDTPVSGTLADNDEPSGDGGNVWTKATDPVNGTVVVNPDGTYTYTPNPGFFGTDSFTYTITDADGDTSTATMTITVELVNDVPEAVNDSVTTLENTPVTGTLTDNDRPSADGGNVWTKTTDPVNGTVVVNPDGTYTYTPNPNFHGTDSFTYTITDANGDTSTATVTIVVESVNDVPVAVDDAVTTPQDTPVTGTLTDNDRPSSDGGNVWTKATDPANGTVVVNPDGTYTYTPNPGFVGSDSFTYTITDVDGDTSTATMTITVALVNDVPEAVNDSATTLENTPVTGTLTGNDRPSNDGGNVWTKTTDPVNGTVVVNPDGSYTYTPNPGFVGTDRFTYTITDVDGDTSTATVTIVVTSTTEVPGGGGDPTTTPQDQPISGKLTNPDNAPGDGGNAWSKTSEPSNGTVVVNPDGSYTYTPNPGFVGNDSFTYTVTRGNGETSTATMTVTVTPDVPVTPPTAPTVDLNPPLVPQASFFDPQPLQPQGSLFGNNPLAGDQAREPSVFFDGATFDRVLRLPIPFHPIVFVNAEVARVQAERARTDPMQFSNPGAASPTEMQSDSIGQGLGFDPNLFVQHSVRSTQQHSGVLDRVVGGRLGRISLTSDWLLDEDTPVPAETPAADTRTGTQAAPEAAPPATAAADAAAAAAAPTAAADAVVHETAPAIAEAPVRTGAPSFSDQLRAAASRAPAEAPALPVNANLS